MSEIIGQEYDCLTGETRPIYSTPEFENQQAKINIEIAQQQADAAAKAEAKAALLAKLGITIEEAQLLLS